MMIRPSKSSKQSRPLNPHISPKTKFVWALLIVCTAAPASFAEILNSATPLIRIRLGDNANGGTNTVIYNPLVPAELGGLPGVTASPSTVSTNAIAGGSGVYTVRVVTDLNARNGLTQLEGTFAYDSSQPMACVTPATCGASTIPFTRISWAIRDNDTHTAVTQFDGTANQVIQVQLDTNPANNQANTRHRNYLQYTFDNADLLPAGTYEATITLTGTGVF